MVLLNLLLIMRPWLDQGMLSPSGVTRHLIVSSIYTLLAYDSQYIRTKGKRKNIMPTPHQRQVMHRAGVIEVCSTIVDCSLQLTSYIEYQDEGHREDPISRRRSPQPKMKPNRHDYEKDYREMSPRSKRLVREYVAWKKQHEGEVIYVSSESDEDEKLGKEMSKMRLTEAKSGRLFKNPYIYLPMLLLSSSKETRILNGQTDSIDLRKKKLLDFDMRNRLVYFWVGYSWGFNNASKYLSTDALPCI